MGSGGGFGLTGNWHVYNRYGDLLHTFGEKDLADRYAEKRRVIGVEVTVKRVVQQRRAA